MRFGIEIEHFLIKNDGTPPTNKEIDEVYLILLEKGFELFEKTQSGTIYSICWLSKWGRVIIKSDFFTHIMEVAFPPVSLADSFSYLYDHVFSVTLPILHSKGINLTKGGSLNNVPERLHLRLPESDYQRLTKLPLRQLPFNSLAHSHFNSIIAATHIHFDGLNFRFYERLTCFYEFEYLVPFLFSNSKEIMGHKAFCIRPLFWRNNFCENHNLVAFPANIPSTKTKYDNQVVLMKKYFFKDYSFISPRPSYSTVEFRGACSQNTASDILSLIALRMAIWESVNGDFKGKKPPLHNEYYEVCEYGLVDPVKFNADLERLKSVRNSIRNDFIDYYEIVIANAEASRKQHK
jgi:hypothetical protein